MNPTRLLRTTSFRLTAIYATAFGLSFILLFALVYWIASNALTRQLQTSINAELAALTDRHREAGTKGLVDEIVERLRSKTHPTTFYLLEDRTGRRLAGNLSLVRPFSGWRHLSAPEHSLKRAQEDPIDDEDGLVLAKGQMLSGQLFLAVGANRHRVTEAEEAILRSIAWGVGATLLLAVGGGLLTSALFLRRLDAINSTSREIVAGNLSDRIPTRGTGDEVDRLAENLNEMLDRIQALMEGLRQVTNDIAHDLRTPLSRVRQQLDTAHREAKTTSDYEVAVENALAETDSALSIFGALLRIAQIESGSRRASFAKVDLSRVFDEVVLTYQPVAEDLGKALVADVSPDVWTIGDRELLVQMIVNLVENALNHTSEHTQACLSLHQSADGPIGIVADNGPGIPEAEREQVFRRFYRLDRSRATPGSGMGLALVAAIGEIHGIEIQLSDSEPGLRVTLNFPKLSI